MRLFTLGRALLLAGVLTFGVAAEAQTIYIVTTTADNTNSDGQVSLREAVMAASTGEAVGDAPAPTQSSSVILFSPTLLNQTITLVMGEMMVAGNTTIGDLTTSVTVDAAGLSRAFRVSDESAEVMLRGFYVVNGTAMDGGAIWLENGSLSLTQMQLRDSQATRSGGALFQSDGTLTISNTTFENNAAMGTETTDGGGALFQMGGMATVSNSTFRMNYAVMGLGNGGGAFIAADAEMTISGGLFEANEAARAGGALELFGDVMADGVTFRDNMTGINGGAVHLSAAGSFDAKGGLVQGNTAGREGGGFWNSAEGTMMVDGTTFLGNEAQGDEATHGGGALYNVGGPMTVTNTTLTGNRATGTLGSGGGIFNNGMLTVEGGTITSNFAERAGGGIEANGGSTTIMGTVFRENDGGTNPGNGGAFHLTGAGTVHIEDVLAEDNIALEGGGLWNSGSGTMMVRNTTLRNNIGAGDDANKGGGGFFNSGGTATIYGGVIEGNSAPGTSGSGGGVFNDEGGTLTIIGTRIQNNAASRAGGGIEDNAGTMMTLRNIELLDNTTSANPGNGGGLHITGAGTVAIDSSLVRGNVASNEGGGLWNSGAGVMTVRRTTVIENEAPDGGGIVQVGTGGTLIIEQSTVSNNTASEEGGGVYIVGGDVEIVNSTITMNSAVDGGGIEVKSGMTQLRFVTLAANSASGMGGGVRNDDAELGLSSVILAGNEAMTGNDCSGGIRFDDLSLVTDLTGCTLSGPAWDMIITQDPMLGALADNGGPTPTHALMEGSPAIAVATCSVDVDQRGFARDSGMCSLGAYEFGATVSAEDDAPLAMTEALSVEAVYPNPVRGPLSVRFAVQDAQEVRVDIYDVTGRRVVEAFRGSASAGQAQTVSVDAAGLASGVYLVRVSGAAGAATQRFTVVR